MENKPLDRFSQAVSSAAQRFGESLGQFAQRLGKETEKLARIASLKTEIFKLQNERRSKLESLGERILILFKGNNLTPDSVKSCNDVINQILSIEEEISKKNAEIKKIQEEEKITDEEVAEIPMDEKDSTVDK